MKLFKLSLFTGLITCCRAGLTKGYIQVKGESWERGMNLSTLFDLDVGDILASESATPLRVQIDLNQAQKVDSDIEILNGFWIDMYPFLGINSRGRTFFDWHPPYFPTLSFINVQRTPNAQLQQRENSYTACYPNPMDELPFQASAIWRYDPSSKKLTPTILGLNGTRLSLAIHGYSYDGYYQFNAVAPSPSREPLVRNSSPVH
ncbi:hypothetical protein DFP72DRAFT_1048072 [Ephemerocybe angulata]|uniref:Uncharacterized protein n=1 Tax=Ephemerocybe angulata TaxID=980116 RepID=A0A8H6HR99_9AGAR|nr:hypothetical protein DFP72DRAFT_1048072 [Tulosesus angulatus]